MADDIDPTQWSDRLASTIGRTVKRLREAREPKMTVQQLADRLAQVGHPIKRTVLTNLETGRRAYLSMADVLALSYALDVAPIQLISPLDGGPAELLPEAQMDPWLASDWLVGLRSQALRLADLEVDSKRWMAGSHIYFLRWQYEQQLRAVHTAWSALHHSGTEADARWHERERQALSSIAEALRDRGVHIPALREAWPSENGPDDDE